MSSLTNIPFDDIIELLSINNVSVPTDKNEAYALAWDLIKSSKINTAPPSVTDWILAYNLSQNKVTIPSSKTSEILISPDDKLIELATLLTLQQIDKERIIRILGYLNKLDNDMNVFDLLPLEVLKQILVTLDRKTIKFMHQISSGVRKLNLQELLKLRRLAGYPRSSKHCMAHHIPASIVMSKFEEDLLTDQNFQIAIKYLDNINADVVKGDLIIFDAEAGYRNVGKVIYDGQKIINLNCDIDEYGSLPMEFHVIENDIPIKYWEDNYKERFKSLHVIGIDHNTIVWFNHRLVRDECLANIKYGLIKNDKYGIYTTFIYDGKEYKIIRDYTDDIYHDEYVDMKTFEIGSEIVKQEYIEEFRKLLLSNKDIVFQYGNYSSICDYSRHCLFYLFCHCHSSLFDAIYRKDLSLCF